MGGSTGENASGACKSLESENQGSVNRESSYLESTNLKNAYLEI